MTFNSFLQTASRNDLYQLVYAVAKVSLFSWTKRDAMVSKICT